MKTIGSLDVEVIHSPIKIYHNHISGHSGDEVRINISRGTRGWIHGDTITDAYAFLCSKDLDVDCETRYYVKKGEPLMFVGIGKNFGGFEWPYFLNPLRNVVYAVSIDDVGSLDIDDPGDYVVLSTLVSDRRIIVQDRG